MRNVAILAILVVVAGVLVTKTEYGKRFHLSAPPLERPAGQAENPCDGKEKCVVYYVAPWCAACKESLPTALEISRRWLEAGPGGRNGLRILVGNASEEQCRRLAKRIGWIASVDTGDAFSKAHKITLLPTWIVFDREGREERRMSVGVPNPAHAEVFIRNGLKL